VDHRWVQAIVLTGVWIVVVLAVRLALRHAFDRYERRLAETDAMVAARRRTTFSFLLRVVIALVALIGVWSVLSIFTVTQEVARAFLASSAVLAIIAGVALSTPLGNLGSGVLLAITQPIRLGDRVTVGEHTGVVSDVTLSYTALVTDDGRHVFVPNQHMVSTMLVNRSLGDPRRIVTVQVPVGIRTPLDEARKIAFDAASRAEEARGLTVSVRVGEVSERVVWLTIVAHASPQADVSMIASSLREKTLAALREAELLPRPSELS
jgi:small-conductance mechanosensitive channel